MCFFAFLLFLSSLQCANAQSSWPLEQLNRGIVALPGRENGIFISWRLLGTDLANTRFDVMRNGKVIARQLTVTNFTDLKGKLSDSFQVITHRENSTDTSNAVKPWTNIYTTLHVNKPEGGVTPDGKQYQYRPNDCSVGDLDGDGEYELILKWDPTNSKDNAHDGYTGNAIIDAYKWNGKQLWRLDLGKNIRAGAHYTQFLVYDFDGDGKAELLCKTAPGSKDGRGNEVSEAATNPLIKNINNTADLRNSKGRILKGQEWLTVFNGATGEARHTVWYLPNRGYGMEGEAGYAGWGDKSVIGNRGERYLACVAFLNDKTHKPSAVFCRGYYTRACLWAVDYDGERLHTRWLHQSVSPRHWLVLNEKGDTIMQDKACPATAYGQGAHSIAVADTDGDGRDEITFGSAAIDDDGSLLYSTGLGHGDAQHLTDIRPERPGLEYYMVHEDYPYGADLRDARTGEILWRETGHEDTGRGLAADIDDKYPGLEMWNIEKKVVRNAKGDIIAHSLPPVNFRIYWDGDLQEELLGNLHQPPYFPPCLMKWDGAQAKPFPLSNGKMLYELGHSATCNWTKATPCLQADIMGDWREELIFYDASQPDILNIFTTNIPTSYRVTTLMHDHIYRMGIAWQNTAYNQPPHLSCCLSGKMKGKMEKSTKDQ